MVVVESDQGRKRQLDFLYDLERDTQRQPALVSGDDYRTLAFERGDETLELQL
jgi:hypothetical protein